MENRHRSARDGSEFEDRRDAYLWVFGVVLFLFFPLDLLVTLKAAAIYGLAPEINPVMRHLIREGPVAVVVVHVVATLCSLALFSGLLRVVERATTPYDRYMERSLQAWLALLLVTGTALVVNNLVLIAFAPSSLA